MNNDYKITLNGKDITKRCNQGFPIKQCLNESLDSATIVLTVKDALQIKPIESYVIIEELNSGFRKDFVVKNYERQIYTKNPVTYKYTIYLGNGKTLFSKKLLPSMAFTQPKNGTRYTLLDCLKRIRNNYPLETATRHYQTRLFNIDENIVSDIKAPQLFLTRPTLSEAIDAVLQVENKTSTFENTFKLVNNLDKSIINPETDLPVLKALDYNMIGNEINNKQIISDFLSESDDEYASSTITYIENGLTEDNRNEAAVVYPGKNLWATMRTGSVIGERITDDNALMIVDRPINEIVKVKIKIASTINLYSSKKGIGIQNYFFEVDITDFVIEKERYDSLKTQSKWSAFFSPTTSLSKNNTLYYVHGDNKIYGIQDVSLSPLGSLKKINAALEVIKNKNLLPPIYINGITVGIPDLNMKFEYAEDNIPTETGGYQYTVAFPNNILIGSDNFVYQVEYIPLTNIVGKSVKYDKTELLDANININQSNNVVDINNTGRNTYGLIQRLGHGIYKLSYRFAKLKDIPKIGDYLNDYVVVEVETANYDNLVECILTLNKNFNMLSMYTGLDQEFRPFEVPKDGITSYLNYEEFIIFSTNLQENEENRYNTSFINSYDFILKTLSNFENDAIISNAQFTTRYYDNKDNYVFNRTLLPVFSTSYGNSMIFAVEFNDVISSGKRLVGKDEKNIKYTDDNGVFERFSIDFLNLKDPNKYYYDYIKDGVTTVVVDETNLNFSNNLPSVDQNTVPSSSMIINTEEFVYEKDPAEIIKFNYYLHCVPAKDSVNKITIGQYFTEKNVLVGNIEEKSLVLWQSTNSKEIYKPLNNRRCLGNLVTNNEFVINVENSYVKISLKNSLPQTVTSWSIGDSDGNLYLGVNGKYQEIYIYFRNKRDI